MTGVWLVFDGTYTFENTFVILGIAVVVIAFAAGPRILKPTGMAAVGAHASGDDEKLPALYEKLLGTLGVIAILLVTVVVAMLNKWGV